MRGRSRSRCRDRRTRCASTAVGRSRGRCSTNPPRSGSNSTGCSCRSAAARSPPAWATASPRRRRARLHAVQAAGCAPLARGWNRAAGLDRPEQHWGDVMTVWDDPHSLADGILDDETYDWIGVFENLRRSGGEPVVASEPRSSKPCHGRRRRFRRESDGLGWAGGSPRGSRSGRRRRAGGGRDEWRRSLTVGSDLPGAFAVMTELA